MFSIIFCGKTSKTKMTSYKKDTYNMNCSCKYIKPNTQQPTHNDI